MATSASDLCGAATMDASSVNIHYHGTNTYPTCHQDEVIHTVINSGESFAYNVAFPADEPPGLYWYHPHIHGIAEAAVQGCSTSTIFADRVASTKNVTPDSRRCVSWGGARGGLPSSPVPVKRQRLLDGHDGAGACVVISQ